MDCRIGGIIFSSNFDSGNLAKVEKANQDGDENSISSGGLCSNKQIAGKTVSCPNNSSSGNSSINELHVDYDFKIWTKPDCAGTAFENGNRTWFYFSVRGYHTGRLARFTIMNMNKQSKIYSQGYAPLYKVSNSSSNHSRYIYIYNMYIYIIIIT